MTGRLLYVLWYGSHWILGVCGEGCVVLYVVFDIAMPFLFRNPDISHNPQNEVLVSELRTSILTYIKIWLLWDVQVWEESQTWRSFHFSEKHAIIKKAFDSNYRCFLIISGAFVTQDPREPRITATMARRKHHTSPIPSYTRFHPNRPIFSLNLSPIAPHALCCLFRAPWHILRSHSWGVFSACCVGWRNWSSEGAVETEIVANAKGFGKIWICPRRFDTCVALFQVLWLCRCADQAEVLRW